MSDPNVVYLVMADNGEYPSDYAVWTDSVWKTELAAIARWDELEAEPKPNRAPLDPEVWVEEWKVGVTPPTEWPHPDEANPSKTIWPLEAT